MRILSQDGMADLPYESIGICMHYHNRTDIIAYPAGTYSPDDEYWTLAHYSTEEKAKKAMEMLRKAYIGTIYIHGVELPEGGAEELKEMVKHGFGIISVVKDTDSVKFEPLNICFQFPGDDEIEV